MWRLECDAGDVYLKISSSDEAFERETTALATASAKAPDLRVPALRAILRSGNALLTTGLPGRVVRTLSPSPAPAVENAIHRHAGEAVRRLHDLDDAQASAPRMVRAAVILDVANEDLPRCRHVLSGDQIRLIAAATDDVISASQNSAMGFVHGDFQPRNWLWSEADDALGVIDFEEASTGFVIEDFAWLFAVAWPRRPDLRESFLSGYGKRLGASDLALLESFTVLASVGHIAGGVRLGNDVRIANGLRALDVSGSALHDRLAGG